MKQHGFLIALCLLVGACANTPDEKSSATPTPESLAAQLKIEAPPTCAALLNQATCAALMDGPWSVPTCTTPPPTPAQGVWLDAERSKMLVLTSETFAVWSFHTSGCVARQTHAPAHTGDVGTQLFELTADHNYSWGAPGNVEGTRERSTPPSDLLSSEGSEVARLTIADFTITPATGGAPIFRFMFVEEGEEEESCNTRRAVLTRDKADKVTLRLESASGSVCVGADSTENEALTVVLVWSPEEARFVERSREARASHDKSKDDVSYRADTVNTVTHRPMGEGVLKHTFAHHVVDNLVVAEGGAAGLSEAERCTQTRQDAVGGSWTFTVGGQTVTLANFVAADPVVEEGPCP